MNNGAMESCRPRVRSFGLLAILFAQPSGAAPSDQAKIAHLTVHAGQDGPKISPLLYGIFFEEINRAGEGGLWAEMIQNRSFEDDHNEPLAWKFSGPVKARLDRQRPLYPQNPTSLRLEFSGSDAGVAQDGFSRDKDRYPGGMAFRKGEALRFSLYQRGECGLEVRLVGRSGKVLAKTSLPAPGGAWEKVDATLEPSATDQSGRLVLVGQGAGEVWIDQLSLMPVSTWKGHGLRRDLAEMIAALKPAFVRFPGGCFVEGLNLPNAPRWKDSIGEQAQRRGVANRWGYQTSGAFGVHEFLQWCEDLGAEPLYVINCGMGHNYTVPMNRMKEWVQDAVDLVEYARGPVDSKWGAMRAAAGHPAPFKLNYLEIGNENGGHEYAERYALFHDALKAKYPDLHLVANFWDGGVPKSRPVEIQDEHYYLDAVGFLGMADYYQRVGRNGPNVYVGEYAVTNGAGNGNLSAALGEAAFLTGLEAVGDHVVMASYAPLLAHPAWKAWTPNAIVFDQGRAYGTPSYHLQTMFSANRGDVACPVELTQPEIPFETPKGSFGVGTWGNTQVEYKDISFTLADGRRIFTGNFTQGMKGWRPFKGVWTVQDGVLRQAGKEDAFELAQIADSHWSDGVFEVKARKVGGVDGFQIQFQAEEDGQQRVWNVGGWGNTQIGLQGILGEPKIAGKVETGRWYSIRIELLGPRIRCFLDGKLIQEVVRPNPQWLYAVASRTQDGKHIILKLVNAGTVPRKTMFDIEGVTSVAPRGLVTAMTSKDGNDENSFEQPRHVVPVEAVVTGMGKSFTRTLPARSVTVLKLLVTPLLERQ
jgi:alpha-L-arabinofuranosidase